MARRSLAAFLGALLPLLAGATLAAAYPAPRWDTSRGDFAAWEMAQLAFWERGRPLDDPDGLDHDRDGIARDELRRPSPREKGRGQPAPAPGEPPPAK